MSTVGKQGATPQSSTPHRSEQTRAAASPEVSAEAQPAGRATQADPDQFERGGRASAESVRSLAASQEGQSTRAGGLGLRERLDALLDRGGALVDRAVDGAEAFADRTRRSAAALGESVQDGVERAGARLSDTADAIDQRLDQAEAAVRRGVSEAAEGARRRIHEQPGAVESAGAAAAGTAAQSLAQAYKQNGELDAVDVGVAAGQGVVAAGADAIGGQAGKLAERVGAGTRGSGLVKTGTSNFLSGALGGLISSAADGQLSGGEVVQSLLDGGRDLGANVLGQAADDAILAGAAEASWSRAVAGKAVGGGVVGGVVSAVNTGVQQFQDYKAGKVSGSQAIGTVVAETAVGVSAGAAGAAAGAAIGSVIPVAGTVVGAVVGAAVGYGIDKLAHMQIGDNSLAGYAAEGISDAIDAGAALAAKAGDAIEEAAEVVGQKLEAAQQAASEKLDEVQQAAGEFLDDAAAGLKRVTDAIWPF